MLGSGARDALAAGGPEAKAAAGGFGGKNVVMFITDQERELMHFPKGWAEKNLPGLTQLKKNGMQFEHAFTNSCMCSPARATLLTGYMPAQHGVRHTLEPDMPADQYPQVELNTELKNIASVMSSAGYSVIYKGKFHLTKPPSGTYTPEDLSKYGFSRWNP
jgi:arylsulfatase A-like enzyme